MTKGLTFKAAVMRAAGTPFTIEQLEAEALESGDVLVRIHAAGVCHTDWEAYQGDFDASVPVVLGHEGSGEVVEIGSGVTSVRVGDHVVFSPFPSCGSCFYCRREQPMLCEPVSVGHRTGKLPDGRTRFRLDGEPINHFLCISSFSEYAIVPQAGVVPLPAGVPHAAACILGCAVLTGVGAALHVAEVGLGESAFVAGCGPVGLNAIQGAAIAGSQLIVASDVRPERRELALVFGAHYAINPLDGDVGEQVKKLTQGRGADHGFETAGNVGAMQDTLDSTRPGGSVTLLGKLPPDSMLSVRFSSLMGEKRIRRSSLGGARARDDIPAFARAYLDGRLKLDELISHRYPLSDINTAMLATGAGSTIRCVIDL